MIFLKWFAAIFVDKFLVLVYDAVKNYIAEKAEVAALKAQLKEKMKDILADKDPVSRAKRVSDLLGS